MNLTQWVCVRTIGTNFSICDRESYRNVTGSRQEHGRQSLSLELRRCFKCQCSSWIWIESADMMQKYNLNAEFIKILFHYGLPINMSYIHSHIHFPYNSVIYHTFLCHFIFIMVSESSVLLIALVIVLRVLIWILVNMLNYLYVLTFKKYSVYEGINRHYWLKCIIFNLLKLKCSVVRLYFFKL